MQDLELIKVHGTYYKDFMKNLESHTNILDLTNVLISQDDIRKCYTYDMYGGHLSKLGNEIVSKLIAKKVRSIMTTEV